MAGEKFILKKATEMSGLTVFKSLKTGLIIAAFIGLGYCIYATVIQPHTKGRIATKTEYTGEKTVNITEIKEGDAIKLSLFPPKIRLGGFELKIFDFGNKGAEGGQEVEKME